MALFGDVAAAVEERILKVEGEIDKVNLKTENAESEVRLVDSSDAESLQYWRKTIVQLRNEKEQLRNEKEQLRNEKKQPVHPKERMRRLLQGLIMEVNEDVLSRCAQNSWLAARLNCLSTEEDALKLYIDAEAIPQSQTRAMAKEKGVTIDGPMQFAGAQTASFFRAFENTKHVRVLKVNNDASKSRIECRRYAALGAGAVDVGIALVPVRLLSLDNSSEHQSTRASPPRKISPFLVFRRIIATIDFIHDRKWMHGDVKPGNIFCDWNGEAWLGDYGSSAPYEELHAFTGGTPKYQCSDVSHLDRARLFDGVGLMLSLLEQLGVLALRGGGGPLCLKEVLAAVSGISGTDADALNTAIFDWIENLRAV